MNHDFPTLKQPGSRCTSCYKGPTPGSRQHTDNPPLISLPFPQHVAVLLQRTPIELCFLPQVRGQEAVRVANGHESCFEGILKSLGGASRGSVDVLDTSELQ